jgi:hypothetical protein
LVATIGGTTTAPVLKGPPKGALPAATPITCIIATATTYHPTTFSQSSLVIPAGS